ncbi:COG4705 family protein [Mycolicibacterium aichiense]|uniref:COG4705 family protein n=1 Tax=Mycolicibacterium aichiense TaxID=1799 RepID=UPI003D668922
MTGRTLLSKVPEVTVWFWVIKILCTTVGESFADWINMTLGVGLIPTALIFTAVLAVVLAWQLSLRRYVPFVYWLAVVVLSVTGTLYTDILTDHLGVPLALSTSAFAVALGVVFAVWYVRERTLSIHSIVTRPRELFYWLAVLITFALGTAVGDWTLQLTGWSPGISVLLPVSLIAVIAVGWRLGANAVLSFWLAYILTRPLGANLGDWLASPQSQGGLGVGTAITSAVFLAAILATVGYLTVSRSDVVESFNDRGPLVTTNPGRERILLGYFLVAAVVTVAVLAWAGARPHEAANDGEEPDAPVASAPALAGSPAPASAHFPASDMARFRSIVDGTLGKVRSGDQAGAKSQISDLETAWDTDESTLRPMNEAAWHHLDSQIDSALHAVRANNPDTSVEIQSLTALSNSLR